MQQHCRCPNVPVQNYEHFNEVSIRPVYDYFIPTLLLIILLPPRKTHSLLAQSKLTELKLANLINQLDMRHE